MPLEETTKSVEDALRRLRDDVAAFRSQDVRENFFAEPVEGDPPRTREALEAYVIQLRTALSSATDKIAALDRSLEDASAAAANDRQAAEDVRMQLDAQRTRFMKETLAERERADALERKHLDAAASAAENAALLRLASCGAMSGVVEEGAQLAAARAALALAEPSLERARADLDSVRNEAEEMAADARATQSALDERLHELEKEILSVRAGRDASEAKGTAASASAAETAGKLSQENAHLRAENAARAEDALRLREELAARTAQMREATAEARRFSADASRVPALQARIDELLSAKRQLRNERTVADALREEKVALARLIGALAPSGEPRDGLAVLRAAALRREKGKPTEVDAEMAKDADEDALAVSRADVAEIVARQEAQLQTEEELRRQVRELEGQLARAGADNKRNRRMRKVLEQERKDHRQRLAEMETEHAGDAGRRIEDAMSAADKFKQLADELMGELRKRDEQLASLGGQTEETEATGGGGGLHKDLCLLLRMENRETAVDVARLRDELQSALKERDHAREELARKDSAADDGGDLALDDDPSTTAVWRAGESPLSLARAKSSEERRGDPALSALKEKLSAIAGGDGDAEMADVGSTAIEVRGVIEKLTEIEMQNVQLRREAKLGQRRKEAAQRKITEVRALMRYVFGWDVRPEGASYFMESIYATDEVLQFSVSDAITFSLKPSAYAVEKLGDEIDMYLQKQNSIPGLMAAVTLGNLRQAGDVDMGESLT